MCWSKNSYFQKLNVKLVRDNKNIRKNVTLLFSNKIRSNYRTTLIDFIISNNTKIVETFQDLEFQKLFSNVVKSLHDSKNQYLTSKTSQTDPALQSVETFSKLSSVLKRN